MEKAELTGANLDFKQNPSFTQEWQSQYNPEDEEQRFLNVFKLSRGFFRFEIDCEEKSLLIVSPAVVNLQRGHAFENFLLMDKEAGHKATISNPTGLSVKPLRKLKSEPII